MRTVVLSHGGGSEQHVGRLHLLSCPSHTAAPLQSSFALWHVVTWWLPSQKGPRGDTRGVLHRQGIAWDSFLSWISEGCKVTMNVMKPWW